MHPYGVVIDIKPFAVHFIYDASDALVMIVGIEVTLELLIEHLHKINVLVTQEMRHALLGLVLDKNHYFLPAKNGQLNRFFY